MTAEQCCGPASACRPHCCFKCRWGGSKPVRLDDNSERTFLLDGDTGGAGKLCTPQGWAHWLASVAALFLRAALQNLLAESPKLCISRALPAAVVMSGHCQGQGYRVGFGECRGTVRPAADL